MTIAAIGLGIFVVTAITSAWSVLSRELGRNYLDTNPASAMIDVGEVTQAHIDLARAHRDILDVEATSIIKAKVERAPGEWLQILLFVVPDFSSHSISKALPNQGAFPPPSGTILLERIALEFLGFSIGDQINIQTPDGPVSSIAISGTVHDPALAPATQQQSAYGYLTPQTLVALGGDGKLEILKIVVRDAVFDQEKTDAVAIDLASQMRDAGYDIHQLQVPPAGKHPHQGQMNAVMVMFGVFAILALVLSAVLTASMMDGLLAQQVRQIAVMKTIGASSIQITGLYLVAVLLIAMTAVGIAVPLGMYAGFALVDVIASLLNLQIASYQMPPLLIFGLVLAGIGIPLMFALVPIIRASRATIQAALGDYAINRAVTGGSIMRRLPLVDRTMILAVRNAFRRRGRLILSLVLLGTAGAMFIGTLGVQQSFSRVVQAATDKRLHDVNLLLVKPVETDRLLDLIAQGPGVKRVEPWGYAEATIAREDGFTLLRMYPDGGHGALEFRSLPDPEYLSHYSLLAGEIPGVDQDQSILVNQSAHKFLGRPNVGANVYVNVNGMPDTYTLAGVIRQYMMPAKIFATPRRFEKDTGTSGLLNSVHIFAQDRNPDSVDRMLENLQVRLEEAGISVQIAITKRIYAQAIDGHVRILFVLLIIMSILMAVVGLLGLASAQGTSVAERTREFGIMRTIGGSSAVIIRNILAEGLFIGLLSVAVAMVLSLALGAIVGDLIGMLSFGISLPLIVSPMAVLIWVLIVSIGTIVASLVPALRAASLTVRQTLAYI